MADDRELAELKREVSTLQDRVQALQERPPAVTPQILEGLGLDTPMGRRQAMLAAVLGGGAAAGALTAASEPAQADAVAADVGTQADPWRTGFFAALNAGDGQQLTDWETGFNAHAATKSSAYSTSGEHFIDVDTSVAGVTITLSTADAVLGHYIVLRQNGANDLTIDTEGGQNIDGSASLTLQHDGAMVILWSDGSDWFSNQFIDTVDARSVVTEKVTFSSPSVGSADLLYESSAGGNHEYDEGFQATDGVSTTATAILDGSSITGTGGLASRTFVVGRDTSSAGTTFYDLITSLNGSGVTVVQADGNGTPSGRTYTLDAGHIIKLAMASDTYDVIAVGSILRATT